MYYWQDGQQLHVECLCYQILDLDKGLSNIGTNKSLQLINIKICMNMYIKTKTCIYLGYGTFFFAPWFHF